MKKNVEFKIIFYPILIGFVIILCSIGVLYSYNRFFKKLTIDKKKVKEPAIVEIPTEVVNHILNQLNDFEMNHLFVQKTLTLAQLAKSFKTNSAYLSKIINSEKGTNFSNYINQLRINYVLHLLMDSDQYHQHSIGDLAELVGFSSSLQFSNVFFQVTSFRPYEYIKQLKFNLNKNN
ncbi:AraC family transcriptional regulator [Empedobacter sp.]|uniref:helix-turn-helix domain-containing protein n=1 Tax=Empedobacter sp. TaxID=1927715 RepID=UPI00289B768F|nr:AraC family transcriptional regulator [Empedobacter sp.]